jgi:hypothetical protein
MTGLVPAHLRPWRCRCGNRHDPLTSICRWTGIPREHQ